MKTLMKLWIMSYALHAYAGTIVVINKKHQTIDLLDDQSFIKRSTIEVSPYPHHAVLSPSGDKAVIIHYSLWNWQLRQLTVIDISSAQKITEIDLDRGTRPYQGAFINERELLVTSASHKELVLVDIEARTSEDIFTLPEKGPYEITYDSAGKKAYLSHHRSGSVIQYDMEQNKITAASHVGRSARFLDFHQETGKLLVINSKDKEIHLLDTQSFLKEIWQRPTVSQPHQALFTPEGDHILTNLRWKNHINIYSTHQGQELKSLQLKKHFDIRFSPKKLITLDNNRVMIMHGDERKLSVLDLTQEHASQNIPLEQRPQWIAHSRVDVGGDPLLTEALRKRERIQCYRLADHLCEDRQGFPQQLMKIAYMVSTASKETLWSIITDMKAYGEWNPFMVKAESTLQPGDPLRFTVMLRKHLPFYEKVEVYSRADHEQLCWGSRIMNGALVTQRCFFLEELADGRTLYYTQESFRGPLANFTVKTSGSSVLNGITREAEAMKIRAEQETYVQQVQD